MEIIKIILEFILQVVILCTILNIVFQILVIWPSKIKTNIRIHDKTKRGIFKLLESKSYIKSYTVRSFYLPYITNRINVYIKVDASKYVLDVLSGLPSMEDLENTIKEHYRYIREIPKINVKYKKI